MNTDMYVSIYIYIVYGVCIHAQLTWSPPRTSADVIDWIQSRYSESVPHEEGRHSSKRDSKKPADDGAGSEACTEHAAGGGPIVIKIVEAEEKINEAEQKITELERKVVDSLRKIKRPYDKFKRQCDKAATTAKVRLSLDVETTECLGHCGRMQWCMSSSTDLAVRAQKKAVVTQGTTSRRGENVRSNPAMQVCASHVNSALAIQFFVSHICSRE